MSEIQELQLADEENGAVSAEEDALTIEEPTQESTEPTPSEDVGAPTEEESGTDDEIDYAELMERDLSELKELFPELRSLGSIAEMKNAMRYASLRDLGLSAEEAYLAARGRQKRQDNRTHLSSAPKKSAHTPGGSMPRAELIRAREIFTGMSDAEIQKLWQRVTG